MSDSLRPHGPPGLSVHGVPRQAHWGWVAISFSRGPSRPKDGPVFPTSAALADGLFIVPAGKPLEWLSSRCALSYDQTVVSTDSTSGDYIEGFLVTQLMINN